MENQQALQPSQDVQRRVELATTSHEQASPQSNPCKMAAKSDGKKHAGKGNKEQGGYLLCVYKMMEIRSKENGCLPPIDHVHLLGAIVQRQDLAGRLSMF